jgi:TRAP-type C4-dicarboxylate transport system permease small subunit
MSQQSETPGASPAPTWFDRLLGAIAWVCKVLTGTALVVMTVIFGWLVFGRYVLNDTPTWVEQLALLLIMLITFLGASVGVHESTHLGVSYFREMAPPKVRLVFTIVTDLMLAVFGLVMGWFGYHLVLFKWGSLIPLIDVPEGLRAVPIAICGGLMFLFSAGHLINMARGVDQRHSLTD